MNYKKFLRAASAALMIVVVITLALTSGASAQTKFTTLYRFKGGKDGASPLASLIFDQAGNLYGSTQAGGAYNFGTVFKLTPKSTGGWSERVLYSFTGGADGRWPQAGLIFDAAGNLYGTTESGGILYPYCRPYNYGCGVVFNLALKPDGVWKESVLYSFCPVAGCSDGFNPYAGLIFDPQGNLYGTTREWGIQERRGTVFELIPNSDGSWKEKVLAHLYGTRRDAAAPQAGLILDQAGNLYGTTALGVGGCGTVFELTPTPWGPWTRKILYEFRCDKDGQNPFGGLIFDPAGNRYGTTSRGGGYLGGIAFKLTPNSDGTWTKSLIHGFGKHGKYLYDSLIFDTAGNLYGTTSAGGHLSDCGGNGCGVVFKLTPETDGVWPEKELHGFSGGKDGAYPYAGVIFDAAGNLYGTTAGDGTTTFGSVFEITP